MQAEIAVGVELPLMSKYADLIVAGKDDPAVSILELGDLADKLLGHPGMPPRFACSASEMPPHCCRRRISLSLYIISAPRQPVASCIGPAPPKTHASPVTRAWWSASR